MKQCRKCRAWKGLDDFYRQSDTRDGRGSYCKLCQTKNAAARQAAKPDQKRLYGKRYQRKPEVKEQRADWNRMRRFMRRKERERAAGVFGNESGSRAKY